MGNSEAALRTIFADPPLVEATPGESEEGRRVAEAQEIHVVVMDWGAKVACGRSEPSSIVAEGPAEARAA